MEKINPVKTKLMMCFLFTLFIMTLGWHAINVLQAYGEVKELMEEEEEILIVIKKEVVDEVVEEVVRVVEVEKEVEREEKRGEEKVCTLELNPVVGRDGKIYDNFCYAEREGVKVDEEETKKLRDE